MQRILITGTNGLLGQKLVYLLLERNLTSAKQYQIIATSRGENRLVTKKGYQYFDLDITNSAEVERVFTQTKPHVVINTAAMTNVDQCEKERKICDAINVDAVSYQLRALEKMQHAEKNYKPHQIRGSRMQQQKTKVLNESCPLAEWEGHEANFGAKSWPQKMTN